MSNIDIHHGPLVKPVSQGNANLCWLATAAMLMSFRRLIPVSMVGLAIELGAPFKSLYEAAQQDPSQGALRTNQVKLLATTLDVRTEGLKSFTIDAWVEMVNGLSHHPLIRAECCTVVRRR